MLHQLPIFVAVAFGRFDLSADGFDPDQFGGQRIEL
jgi:hypothetical protein